ASCQGHRHPLVLFWLLLHEMTMVGLHVLHFTEEKLRLQGQDAELVSGDPRGSGSSGCRC
uniref:Uncharacterized protein n=1 Tax=Melopsittacus undulatus TaxID=13146 RepID=A0A8V5GUA9_MELUD